MSSASTTSSAVDLLKDTTYFHDASADLLEALAAKMKLVQAEHGHVFVHEGQPVENLLFLQEGTLVRTKLSVSNDNDRDAVQQDLEQSAASSAAKGLEERIKHSIVVDRLTGRGRVSGLLHCCGGPTTSRTVSSSSSSRAFATVSTESSTGSTVWLLGADDFRELVSQTPKHCLEVLSVLSRELRVGSKSLRGLVEKVKSSHLSDSEKEDGAKSTKTMMIRCLCYDTTSWVSEGFGPAIEDFNKKQKAQHGDDAICIAMDFTSERLSEQSATFAAGYTAVCLFVNDTANEQVLKTLSLLGVKLIVMRCAGYDRVDTKAATAYGFTVARVPAYSPYAVAEMAVALLLAVNRKIAKASARVKMANFTLDTGLMGMDIHGKTIGIMGTGKIGQILCKIVLGFGCKLLCYDNSVTDEIVEAGGTYVSKDEIFEKSDVLFLMMPLLPATKHTICNEAVQKLKPGVILINTSRGGLVDTEALLHGIRDGIVGGVGMDVYEHEQAYFFQDWSARHIQDHSLLALIAEPSVVLTAHQAFFTKEAVDKIIGTTLENLLDFRRGKNGETHPNSCIQSKP